MTDYTQILAHLDDARERALAASRGKTPTDTALIARDLREIARLIDGGPDMHVTDETGAQAMGFPDFNPGPHLCVHVPDEMFTVSAKTSTGKAMTFCFVPYTTGGAAGCVDVKRHDGETITWNREAAAVFDTIVFKGGRDLLNTCSAAPEDKAMLLTVLLEKE